MPELASRDHLRKIAPLLHSLLAKTGLALQDLQGVAYTAGPGLVGALLVGACFGRSLAYALAVPSIAVHHMEAHLLAPMLEPTPPEFPFLALLVSGGHTQLVEVTDFGQYRLLGETLDDALGEAFDKTAKLLGLGYPGGPVIEALASTGDPKRYHFPRPMVDRPGLDFSFSGLKTFTLNTWQQSEKDEKTKADIARAFQDAALETLVIKCKRALAETNLQRLVIAGGVGANQALRRDLNLLAKDLNIETYYPRSEFCTDNGAMVAYAGCQRLLRGEQDPLKIEVFARKKM